MSDDLILILASYAGLSVLFIYIFLVETRIEVKEDRDRELIAHFNKKYSELVKEFNILAKKTGYDRVVFPTEFSHDPKEGPKHYIPSKDIDNILKGKKLDVFD